MTYAQGWFPTHLACPSWAAWSYNGTGAERIVIIRDVYDCDGEKQEQGDSLHQEERCLISSHPFSGHKSQGHMQVQYLLGWSKDGVT